VAVSVASALILRFLLFGAGSGPSDAGHSSYVSYSILAFRNVLPAGILFGVPLFIWYLRMTRRAEGGRRLQEPYLALLTFSALFLGLSVVSALLPAEITFPRLSLWIAWLLCVGGYLLLFLAGHAGADFQLPVPYTRTTQFAIDLVTVIIAILIAYYVRFDGTFPTPYRHQLLHVGPYIAAAYLLSNVLWGGSSAVWRFTSADDAIRIGLSVFSTTFILLLVRILVFEAYEPYSVPFGVLLVLPFLVFAGLVGVRGLRRIQFGYAASREGMRSDQQQPRSPRRVLLVGAGQTGLMLARELERRRDFLVLGFLDDDRNKLHRRVGGVKVVGSTRDIRSLAAGLGVSEVVLSMPSAPGPVLRRVVSDCESIGLRVSSVPSLGEIVTGKVRVGRLRPVRMEDLLGRDNIEFPSEDRELVETYSGKRVLVTGAAGSIGSELARQLLEFRPAQLILFDKDENGLFELGLNLREHYSGALFEVVGDVRDTIRLESVFTRFQPQVVLHAAAYKHVPMMEHNPTEAVLNNIFGTSNLVGVSARSGVSLFLLISTDKAINPTNVMGATKRVAEMIVRRATVTHPSFRGCCVRFGNVLGSRASVVPIFLKRIAEGKNIQITHPDIRRYFMTIPEAVQLVLQAGSLAGRGETFVLDMGDPVLIVDLARGLIEQSGLRLGEDIDIEYTGLRPGEKLYEELLIDRSGGSRSTKYPKIFIDPPATRDPQEVEQALQRLREGVESGDAARIYEVFESLGMGYRRVIHSLPAEAVGQ